MNKGEKREQRKNIAEKGESREMCRQHERRKKRRGHRAKSKEDSTNSTDI
jgi:hypothetical protein